MREEKNLSVFKPLHENRPLDKTNLMKIKRSIMANNLLRLRPILVDAQMRVLDGQHRLAVCKELNIPIYYEVASDVSNEDIILLNNNQKSWKLEDYVHHFRMRGFQDYEKLYQFANQLKLPLSVALTYLGASKGMARKDIRVGKYKFPNNINSILDCYGIASRIQEYLRKFLIGPRDFTGNNGFVKALIVFLQIKDVDRELFVQKVEQHSDLIKPCVNTGNYLEMFRKVYNYKNRHPLKTIETISLEEEQQLSFADS